MEVNTMSNGDNEWSPKLRAFAILERNRLVLSDKHYCNMELYYECENVAQGLPAINKPVATHRYKWPWAYLGESGAEYFYAVMPYCNADEVLEFDLVGVDLVLGIVKKYWTITEADFEHARKSLNQEENIA